MSGRFGLTGGVARAAAEMAWWATTPVRAGADHLLRTAEVLLVQLITRIVEATLAELNLTEIVLEHVDLDAVVTGVDIDEVIGRVDLDAIVGRLDLNALADRLDLDSLVAKVDLVAVVDRLDVAAVAAKVDPDPIVARVDFDAAITKIDLIGLAQMVVDGINLPAIIRDSTGSLASEAVQGVRAQGQQADDAVGLLVGRLLRRRAALGEDGRR